MDYLTPFHVGWDEFVDMFYNFFVGPQFYPCDVSFGSSYVRPLRDSRRFVLMSTLAPFFELISHGMLLMGSQWLLL
jgi:hypothetical protein